MSEPTLYQESGCLIHSVPGIDAITEAEACVKCGAERRWVVPVEPDEIMVIGEYGTEGEHMDRIFQADYAGEVGTSRLKQGTYAIIKIGDNDGGT